MQIVEGGAEETKRIQIHYLGKQWDTARESGISD